MAPVLLCHLSGRDRDRPLNPQARKDLSMKSLCVSLLATLALVLLSPQAPALAQTDSVYITANPYLGAPLSSYDSRVSPYSAEGALNPYTTGGGKIYAQDGTYLGRLNANGYDPESVSNPYGIYGSRYSATSINNPYSAYGSRYSRLSATNPYTSTPPVVVYGDDY